MNGARCEGLQTIQERVEALRAALLNAGLTAYIVPSTDPHQSEYTPVFWQRRQWLSGFTGSVGDIVVTAKEACLWTDSRYYIQAEKELSSTPFKLQRMGLPHVLSLNEWLGLHLGTGDTVGIDPQLLTLSGQEELEKALKRSGAKLKLIEQNLVDSIWGDARPAPPHSQLRLHSVRYTGETRASKLDRLRQLMACHDVTAHVVTRLDSVAWLYNIRGSDVDFTPIAVAYGLVTKDRAFLFIDLDKVSNAVFRKLNKHVEIRSYDDIFSELKKLGSAKVQVWVDPTATTARIGRTLRGARLFKRQSPIVPMKARKNTTEIKGAQAAHQRDGIALVRFLCWLEDAVKNENVTEISAAQKLESLRSELDFYQGSSFCTISAAGSHGAIVHYAPSPDTNRRLRPNGIYLIDSGGQFLDGTTDVTRTVLLGGEPTATQKDQFTRVLKGSISLATMRFPAGVSGQRLDAFARRYLWEAGLDYGHGTGHGVGSFLGVHESPPGIAPARLLSVALEEGHILSNEPGYYRAGRYGIRVENLMVVVRDKELSKKNRHFLKFETLTLCPIDYRLIDGSLLDSRERQWIDDYHARVRESLLPALNAKEALWLRCATNKLEI